MIRSFARAFSTYNSSQAGKFNILGAFSRLGSAIRAPMKHLRRNLEPTGVNYQTITNTTEEAFDEVSQEWQALLVGNPYDVNIMNTLEAVIQNNFGTVDNPHVVFTSEAPFRYVGCTGQPNEDDYEGHEFLIFMLREGPLQRCPSCGQVYKLVRLRNEYSPEMDYYASSFIPYDVQEMGESDTTINLSLARFQKDSYEYSQFETPSNMVYNLVNPDEHDRLLTDPAYRVERAAIVEEKFRVFAFSLRELENEYYSRYGGAPRWPMPKTDYETLIQAELAIRRLDRIFERVSRFHARKFVDRANHERREKRMRERAAQRWETGYTFFTGGLTEEELKYRDYFETDLELYPENEQFDSKRDFDELLSTNEYRLDQYDFQESYLKSLVEEDASSSLQRLAFRFKYRRAHYPIERHIEKETRMNSRQLARFSEVNVASILEGVHEARLLGNKAMEEAGLNQYYEFLRQDAVQSFHDYFESDGEEDLKLVDGLAETEKAELVTVVENYAQQALDTKLAVTVPRRNWNPSLGIWQNFLLDFQEYNSTIRPAAERLLNQKQLDVVSGYDVEKLQKIEGHSEEIVGEATELKAIKGSSKQ
eukprot:TRINITY_DN6531_c0_g1_i1.p1 TRINITY_DN6531_c0_g1~~TRINITY_DN6531_c0_g1_i1.p1  ORF type:complete len:592 (+),score=196.83 TRINITY_DN6531_c0_g1_i1:313-2088(+)